MGKFLWIAFVTTVLSAAAAFAGDHDHGNGSPNEPETRYAVTCESHGGYVECETGMEVENVTLDVQYSNEACTFGGTWGYHDTRIWVNHGCRAEFSFDDANEPRPTPPPVPTPRPPAPRDAVDCRWNNMNWQPWYRVDGHFIGRAGHGFQDPNMCTYSVQQSRRNAICNWNGIGFTSYDIQTNVEVKPFSYRTVEDCYAALR
jgi:Protein of unknown function (DUF3011)